jgi:two-component system chemotaxis sensor kinase CheA
VVLILDIAGISQCTRIVSAVTREVTVVDKKIRPPIPSGDRAPLLLCAVGVDGRMAIPLALVFRLEQFSASSLEGIGDRMAVRHRDHVLPLLNLDELLPPHRRSADRRRPPQGDETVNVVIYSDGQRRVGLVVDRIIDIIDDAITTELVGARKGVIGSALIQGRVTELVDVVEAILCIDPTFPISAPDFPGWSEDARP